MDPLIENVYKTYQMTRTEFSKFSNIPYKTLEGWETKGCSPLGTILLNKFLEIKELEAKHQSEIAQFKDEATRFKTIKEALS